MTKNRGATRTANARGLPLSQALVLCGASGVRPHGRHVHQVQHQAPLPFGRFPGGVFAGACVCVCVCVWGGDAAFCLQNRQGSPTCPAQPRARHAALPSLSASLSSRRGKGRWRRFERRLPSKSTAPGALNKHTNRAPWAPSILASAHRQIPASAHPLSQSSSPWGEFSTSDRF